MVWIAHNRQSQLVRSPVSNVAQNDRAEPVIVNAIGNEADGDHSNSLAGSASSIVSALQDVVVELQSIP